MLEKDPTYEIRELIDKAEYEIAISHIKEALNGDPENGYLNYLFAVCYHKQNIELDKALYYYNLALEQGFIRAMVFYLRGSLYYQLGNSDAAGPDLERAISLNPELHQPKRLLEDLQLGLCEINYLVNKRKFGDALPKLKLLLNKNPYAASIHYLIAVCLSNMRSNYVEALDHYNLALKCGYDEFWVRYNRGVLYRELTNNNAARADLEIAVSIEPYDRDAKRHLEDIQISELNNQGIVLSSPVLVSCIPKSGTMLLKNILLSILGSDLIAPPGDSLASSEYIKALPNLKNRIYYGHIWYSDLLAQKVSSMPKIILLRDPRSTVVSLAHFLDGVTNNHWTKEQYENYWNKKSWEEKISAAIFGMSSVSDYPSSILDTFLNYALKWAGPDSLFVRYEDLIGSRFGGDDTKVMGTINSILDFLGIKNIDQDTLAKKVAIGTDPARSTTFRSGRIDSWRDEFTAANVKQMKMAAPDLVSSLGYEADEDFEIDRNRENTIKKFALLQIDTGAINRLVTKTKRLDWDDYLNMRKQLVGDVVTTTTIPHHAIDEWAFNTFNEAQQIENALRVLELHLLVSVPYNPRWNYYYAFYLHILRRDLQKALQHYNIALENGFDEFWVRYNRGVLFKELGNLDRARIDLECAVLIDPQSEATHKILKEVKEQTTPPPKNIGGHPPPDLSTVEKLVYNSEFRKAREQLQELLDRFPNYPKLSYLYAYCLHQLKEDLDTALSHYDNALRFGFDEFWVRYSRGCLLCTLGDHKAARIDLERAASIEPMHKGPRVILEQLIDSTNASTL